MHLRPDALRFVLAQGLPAVIEVVGGSMAPTVEKGSKVHVVGVPADVGVDVGDVVLIATNVPAVLLLHRVMCVFDEGGLRFVVHQGDARASTFGTCARKDVLARLVALDDEGDVADGRPASPPSRATLARLDTAAQARFRHRRLACEAFVVGRLLARAFGLADRALVRRCARGYRSLVRALLQ